MAGTLSISREHIYPTKRLHESNFKLYMVANITADMTASTSAASSTLRLRRLHRVVEGATASKVEVVQSVHEGSILGFVIPLHGLRGIEEGDIVRRTLVM